MCVQQKQESGDLNNLCAGLCGEGIAGTVFESVGVAEIEELLRIGEEAAWIQREVNPYFEALRDQRVVTSAESQ
jgi:hypothetical protein